MTKNELPPLDPDVAKDIHRIVTLEELKDLKRMCEGVMCGCPSCRAKAKAISDLYNSTLPKTLLDAGVLKERIEGVLKMK